MNPVKLIGWVAIAICVVGAFVEIPYAALILVLLGLAAGFTIAGEDHVRVLVTALVLYSLSTVVLNNIPELGEYLVKIFSAAATFAGGAALMIISRNIWKRYKP